MNSNLLSQGFYTDQGYNSLSRWISFYYQIRLVLELRAIERKTVLEIGVGSRFVSRYLHSLGLRVTTCDINQQLQPNCVANALYLPFHTDAFDVILCYQVLEHLPRKNTLVALAELRRVTRCDAIISLPYSGLCISAYIKRPLLSGFNFRIPLPIHRPAWLIKKLNLQHHWALGEYQRSPRQISQLIAESGFDIVRQEIPLLNNHHHFWVLRVPDGSE